jgi:hypothetical protein
VASIIGKPGQGTNSDREKWVVFQGGRFPLPSAPAPPKRDVIYTQHWVVIDATTGEVDAWGLKNALP